MYAKKPFVNESHKNNWTLEPFKNLLKLATSDSFFIFNDIYYKQKDGLAAVSLLDPVLR